MRNNSAADNAGLSSCV